MAEPEPIAQSGVIPFRHTPAGIEVLLITARKSGRWIVPKGNLASALNPRESAAREAWEEAGVIGDVLEQPTAIWAYKKRRRHYAVTLYPMAVTGIRDEWPEQHSRRRQWIALSRAAGEITNASLRSALDHFARHANQLAP